MLNDSLLSVLHVLQVVEGLSQTERRLLLRFWTGITHLPAAGFRGLGSKLQIMGLDPPDTAGDGPAAAGEGGPAAAVAAQPVAMEAEAAQPGNNGVTNSSRSNANGVTNHSGSGSAGAGSSGAAADGSAVRRAAVLQLPRAHTCFMQLLLPMGYRSVQEMREALLIALQNVDYFGRT